MLTVLPSDFLSSLTITVINNFTFLVKLPLNNNRRQNKTLQKNPNSRIRLIDVISVLIDNI